MLYKNNGMEMQPLVKKYEQMKVDGSFVTVHYSMVYSKQLAFVTRVPMLSMSLSLGGDCCLLWSYVSSLTRSKSSRVSSTLSYILVISGLPNQKIDKCSRQ